MAENQKDGSLSLRVRVRVSKELTARARRMRHSATDAEQLLWHRLRDRQLGGFKFRRQLPIPPYIVDFVCLGRRLIVEIDGGQRADRRRYDDKRTRSLEEKGYRVVRFWNHDVLLQTEAVLEAILEALAVRAGK